MYVIYYKKMGNFIRKIKEMIVKLKQTAHKNPT